MSTPKTHVRTRAYFLARNSGADEGATDLDHWLHAESQEERLASAAVARLGRSTHMHPDLSTVDLNRAMRIAVYDTHRFCITLPPEASLLDDDGKEKTEIDRETLAIFVHEYTHFMHNVGTVSGLNAYAVLLELLAMFSRTLNNDGFCEPPRLLPQAHQDALVAVKTLELLDGMRRLPPHPSPAVDLRVLSILERDVSIAARTIPTCDVQWEIVRRDSTIERTCGTLGTYLIEEGIAYILESAVREGYAAFDDQWTPQRGPPIYPYLAFQALCRHMAPSITATSAARLGLLALNTNRPGQMLVRLLAQYHALDHTGQRDGVVADYLQSSLAPALASSLRRARDEAVTTLPHMFANRGLLADGAELVKKWFVEGLSDRIDDTCFDIRWAFGASIDTASLSRLLLTRVPCDVIQQRGMIGGRNRAELVTFRGGRSTPRELGGVRALQAQLDFLLAHLTVEGFRSTEDAEGHKCPYAGFCQLELRESEPATCGGRPWSHWRADPTCWYGVGVAGTMGFIVNGPPDASAPMVVDRDRR